jgi:hypothetical protein
MPGQVLAFNDVFREEISVINRRRQARERPPIILGADALDPVSGPILGADENANLVGLALSGGGLRSTAFCLGALQALDQAGVLERVDYLSTVSGGGYVGCSLSAGMEATHGKFPFDTRVGEYETPSTQHVRSYCNYLFPRGAVDIVHNVSIYVSGLAVNFLLIMPFLLLAAANTIFLNPKPYELRQTNLFGFKSSHFTITAYLGLLLLVTAIALGLIESLKSSRGFRAVPNKATTYLGLLVLLVFFSAFCEMQPVILASMFDQTSQGFLGEIWPALAALAPIAVIIAVFADRYAQDIDRATKSTTIAARVASAMGVAAIYLAAIIVPFLLWMTYLTLSYWGICLNALMNGFVDCVAPDWLFAPATRWFSGFSGPAAHLYLMAAIVFLCLALLLRPNTTSLHALYRDRLGKAFLFEPRLDLPSDGERNPLSLQHAELKPLPLRLSQLSGEYGPYHLINTALITKSANKRGRNTDFFLLSQQFVGSEATGYMPTREMEEFEGALDLASVMAVTRPAGSSEVRMRVTRALNATLAVLNLRLGYWLRNPSRAVETGRWRATSILESFYFLLQLFGLNSENRESVYLTEGGDIENLGIYELLKRRCRVIIAIDVESDPEMAFGSFNTLVRYARIDLGLEINLPWQRIANVHRATRMALDKREDCPKSKGPHCAIGEIRYSHGRKGVLVYLKASLTGDENDDVLHYARNHSDFPHERTADYNFSQEQFEVYRVLGFHGTFGLFDRRDDFAKFDVADVPSAWTHAELLDRLFPRVSTEESGSHERFVDLAHITHDETREDTPEKQIVRAFDRVGDRFDRVGDRIGDRIARLQINPMLDNFDGLVIVRLQDVSGRDLLLMDFEGSKFASAASGQRCKGVVIFESGATESIYPFMGRIAIKDGNEADNVTFDVALDSDEIVFEPRGGQRTFRSRGEKSQLEFAFVVPTETGAHNILVEVSQKNRLVQVVRAGIMVETSDRPAS